MKKIFVVVFIALAFTFLTVDNLHAGYSDRESTIGIATSLSVDTFYDTKSEYTFVEVDSVVGLHISGKFGDAPVMFGADFSFLLDGLRGLRRLDKFDLSVDWWIVNPTLLDVEIFSIAFYTGAGLSFGYHIIDDYDFIWNKPLVFDLGVRIPLGLSFIILDSIELYTEFLLGLDLIRFSFNDKEAMFGYRVLVDSEDSFGDFWDNYVSKGVKIGARYWF